MNPQTSSAKALPLAIVATLSAACIAVALFATRVGFFRESDPDGTWHVRLWDASAVAVPLTFLLFALGVQWAMRQRAALAVLAMLPLVAWIACVRFFENVLANDVWVALITLQLQGLNPFGVS